MTIPAGVGFQSSRNIGSRVKRLTGIRHPGTSAVAIYRHLVADIRERAADDRGWGLFLLRATGPHPIADGSLADMVVLGEDVALWA